MRNTRNWLAALALLLPLAACDIDGMLDVPDPDVVAVPIFQDPENLPAVRAGAVREFARALGGTQNDEGGQVLYSGLFADEFYHSGSFTTRQEVDARNISETNGGNQTAFFWLQRARNHAELAADMFADSDEANGTMHAEVLNLAGFSYILFGENYCSGVPYSRLPIQGQTVFGEPTTREETFDVAMDRFDAAIAMTAATTSENRAARIGKARALVNLGRYDEAAAVVADIPTSFQRVVPYSGSVAAAWNAVWNLNNQERRWSAASEEGVNGLPFEDDPRTPIEFTGPGFDARFDHYNQLKYDQAGDDIVLASGIEARLIEAEAALAGGDRAEFFRLHNELRAMNDDLGALSDTGQTTDQLEDLHFAERAYWLWLTAHRLGDLRRLVLQYDRAPETVYPIGPTVQNSTRGNHLTLRVPFTERENPNYTPSACDPTQAG